MIARNATTATKGRLTFSEWKAACLEQMRAKRWSAKQIENVNWALWQDTAYASGHDPKRAVEDQTYDGEDGA